MARDEIGPSTLFSAADEEVLADILHALDRATQLTAEETAEAVRILVALARDGEMSFTQLCDVSGVPAGSAERILKRLRPKVGSRKLAEDGRVRLYSLTVDGIELAHTLVRRRREQLKADRLRPHPAEREEPFDETQWARESAAWRSAVPLELAQLVSDEELFG